MLVIGSQSPTLSFHQEELRNIYIADADLVTRSGGFAKIRP
jgi:hypothetical protein